MEANNPFEELNMVQIALLDRSHLPQVLELVNSHLSTVIPGWSLTPDYFWERLKSNSQEYITDPWVVERKSIVGIVRDRVCAAAHLLRYGEDTHYKGVGEIDWILFLARRARSWRGGSDGVPAPDECLAGSGRADFGSLAGSCLRRNTGCLATHNRSDRTIWLFSE